MRAVKIRRRPVVLRTVVGACALLFASELAAQAAGAPAVVPAYRYRLLGVFDEKSGDVIEGAEVYDMVTKMSSLTTKTGTLSLIFLPDGGSIVRIRKVGYQPVTMPIAISPDDTIPVTVTLTPSATTLPTVVTTDSAPHYLSGSLRGFEERRRQGAGGHFVTEAELRKHDDWRMSDMVRHIPGMTVTCNRGVCVATSTRVANPKACQVALFTDGVLSTDRDLDKINVDNYGGIEFYGGGASIPPQFNATGSACGVLLLWTRER